LPGHSVIRKEIPIGGKVANKEEESSSNKKPNDLKQQQAFSKWRVKKAQRIIVKSQNITNKTTTGYNELIVKAIRSQEPNWKKNSRS
jgi:hypothetical protein